MRQIFRFLERLFAVLAPGPVAALTSRRALSRNAVACLSHRFISSEGVYRFLRCVRSTYLVHGSLEGAFLSARDGRPAELRRDLAAFLGGFRRCWGESLPRERDFLFPRPERGSACKRHNLFLRWMVRGPDDVDLGLWSAIDPGDLIVPLDTHMARLGKCIGLTARVTPDWRMAEEITSALRTVCPEDPVQFDYPLTRLGILRICTRRSPGNCATCPLAALCLRRAADAARK